jgi:hypothetical protein
MAFSFPTSTFAQNQIDDEARSVTAGCHEAFKRTGQLQTFEAGICLGILKGLHYLSKEICIPPATSLGQIAQHATATCCRGCLAKWHGIQKGQQMRPGELAQIATVIARWLRQQSTHIPKEPAQGRLL